MYNASDMGVNAYVIVYDMVRTLRLVLVRIVLKLDDLLFFWY